MPEKLQRITCVEDAPDIRAIIEFALRNLGGFCLDVCASGAEALERTPDFNPDLIILDVMMPGMDGIEIFNRLRAFPKFAGTPIVFMTARAKRDEIDGYLAMGATDVIAKPFHPRTLATRIEKIWRQAQPQAPGELQEPQEPQAPGEPLTPRGEGDLCCPQGGHTLPRGERETVPRRGLLSRIFGWR